MNGIIFLCCSHCYYTVSTNLKKRNFQMRFVENGYYISERNNKSFNREEKLNAVIVFCILPLSFQNPSTSQKYKIFGKYTNEKQKRRENV